MKEIYRNKEFMYSVSKNEKSNDFFIEVACGGIGMYEIKIKLLPEEIETFKNNPEKLNELAKEIAKKPEYFLKRGKEC